MRESLASLASCPCAWSLAGGVLWPSSGAIPRGRPLCTRPLLAQSCPLRADIGPGGAAPDKQRRWTAHTAPDGRTYYYNKETKKSAWIKPPDFEALIEVPPSRRLRQPAHAQQQTRPCSSRLARAAWPQPAAPAQSVQAQLPALMGASCNRQAQGMPALGQQAHAGSPLGSCHCRRCRRAQAAEPAKPESDWKEFTAPDGRKYYHNKKTNESKWHNPDAPKAGASPAPAAAAPSASAPVQVPHAQLSRLGASGTSSV